MIESLILGFVQGITEWLPVSSQGSGTAVSTLFFQRSLADALLFAAWLHLGTVLAALIVFRKTIQDLVMGFLKRPFPLSPTTAFLLLASVVSGTIGFPLLLLLDQISAAVGSLAMALVGVLMLVTGILQVRQPALARRPGKEPGVVDALLVGGAQGFAALPGLSRSGLTVAALLARGFDRREALALSFLMSIPASLGAALYGGLKGGMAASPEALVAAGAAFIVGLATVRGLLAVAGRVNFGAFVLVVGAALILSAAAEVLFL